MSLPGGFARGVPGRNGVIVQRKHQRAVASAVRSGEGVLTAAHAPLVELCKVLAVQMDAAGPDGPSARLAAAYLSALKDLTRALSGLRTPSTTSKLARLRAVRLKESS